MEIKEGVRAAIEDKLSTAKNGIFFANPKAPMLAQAAKLGLIEFNTNMVGEVDGQFAARLTEIGNKEFASIATPKIENGSTPEMNETVTTTPAPASAGNIAGYAVATVAPPTVSKRGKWSPIFEALGDGQSVFIPATEDMSDPKATLASTITGQNKKELDAAKANGTAPKYFKTFSVDGAPWGHPGVSGAAIYRLDSERKSS